VNVPLIAPCSIPKRELKIPMRTDELDYDLPEDRIAQTPLEPRDSARLLTYLNGRVNHKHVYDLPSLLKAGDLLVVNDTKVLPARFHLHKSTGAKAEVLLLERDDSNDTWRALVKPGRKLQPGAVLTREGCAFAIEIVDIVDDGQRRVKFLHLNGSPMNVGDEMSTLLAFGEAPLPPYITTPLDNADRYQTVYADRPGSVAAPTAGLHLTQRLLGELRDMGVTTTTVELVVGLDTFRPVATDVVEDHIIHTERYRVSQATWDLVQATQAQGGRVCAVGTTSVRSLESAAARGELEGRTNLFIVGEYPWAVVDLLMTNFHLPRTTLLALLGSFVGPTWRDLYAEAIRERYRFLSFGDAMFVDRQPTGPPKNLPDVALTP
jgi:S-adenosylmethionine:tRNA ribosyltransferase-isomerase